MIEIKINHTGETEALLKVYEGNELIISSNAMIGKNGVTQSKIEGDGKTPIGTFEVGIAFGMHNKNEIDTKIPYIEITPNLYWVDDVKSKNYNQLVDIAKFEKDWVSAEHLIDYPIQYEYGIEIKTNPNNVPDRGSAIFLHCTSGKPTLGCIATEKETMQKILQIIDNNTMIKIE